MLYRILHFFFFFNDTATTEIYTLSLHDALPISHRGGDRGRHALRHHHGGPHHDARGLAALALPLLVPADGAGEDLRDQRVVLDARRLGDEHQVAPARREPRERVALEEVHLPLLVHAEVDARHVAAAERDEALARRPFQRAELRGRKSGRHVV